MRAEILTDSRTRGSFSGVALSGALSTADANESLYGRKSDTSEVLVDENAIRTSTRMNRDPVQNQILRDPELPLFPER